MYIVHVLCFSYRCSVYGCCLVQKSFTSNLCVTDGDMAIAMFSVDEELSQCTSTVPLSVHDADAEMCLMTPPRHPIVDSLHWTPTANLKLLLKAASPDLHSREMLHSQNEYLVPPRSDIAVADVTVATDRNAGVTTADKYTENISVSVDKRRRKDKSLGLLCER